MNFKLGNTRIEFNFYFFAMLVLFLLFDKTGLFIYLFFAVAAHETGHILAMIFCRVKIGAIKFTPFGLRIQRRQDGIITTGREVMISLSGSFVNLLLALVFYLLPLETGNLISYAINMAMGLFNLLPIKGLDGGSITAEIMEYCLGNRGRQAAYFISGFFTVLLFLVSLYLWYYGELNLSLVALCVYLIILFFRRT